MIADRWAQLAKLRTRRAEMAQGVVAGARRARDDLRDRLAEAVARHTGDQARLADQRDALRTKTGMTAQQTQNFITTMTSLRQQAETRRQQMNEIEVQSQQGELALQSARADYHRLQKEAAKADSLCQHLRGQERRNEILRDEEAREELGRLALGKPSPWRGGHAR